MIKELSKEDQEYLLQLKHKFHMEEMTFQRETELKKHEWEKERMNRKLMFSNKNNAWCTPRDFFNELNKEFRFTLDPCCMEKSALCKKYFTPDEDGLQQNWEGETVFVNPPYGREIGKWVKKCYEESLKSNTIVVMLIPARTDTKYFHSYIYNKGKIRFLKGRLKFIDLDYTGKEEDRKISPAPFPSMIVIFTPKSQRKE